MSDCAKFYGFSEDPFDISPNPKFFFPSESHNEALASLLYGISHKKGFILILGENGIGKTTIIHHLINQLDEKVTTLFFPQSHLPFHQILKEMLLKLNLPLGLETKGSMIHELYHHLIRCMERDETVTVIIDEAQNIGMDVIEEVRLLANLETSTSKLLQIALVGQPALGEKLRSDVIRQIKQRIVISYRINPLTEEESIRYIDHRLKIVGSSAEVFTDEALSLICRYAKGIPLALNILCNNALSVGYGRSEERISPSTVKKVRGEKEILTSEKTQILTSGFKRYLPHKISYVIPALVIFAIALFFGRSYWQPLFYAQQPNQSVTQPAIKDKTIDSAHEVQNQDAAEYVAGSPDLGIMARVFETLHIPVTPPATASHPNTEVRTKEIIEVKEGDKLYSIAFNYHKIADETFIDYILKLNPEITNANLIFVDQKIKIPEMTESSLFVQSSEGQYQVHLRTFRNQTSATQYRHSVASMGKEIEIVSRKVSPEEIWYRVMAGPFAAKNEGLKFIEEMKKKGFSIIPSKKKKS
jgi:general secretion pathway protein A